MPATALDSLIFRDIFSTEAMRRVFSDEQRTAYYLEIEAALARVQGRLGIIPAEAAREIEAKCRIENIDLGKLKQQTERIGYPILGVVQQIVAICADGLGEWCHWGATTQDITDTATVMQIRAALDLVEADMEKIAAALAGLARRYRDTPMAGRSNLQQAVPITFGFKAASLLAAFQRHRQRLAQLRPRVLVGEFAGAAGTLASLGTDGLKVQAALMQELKLGQPEIAWHTVRDRIGEVGCFLGLLTGTLGKIAMDVKLLMQTEVAEAFEPFAQGRGSSSTMPQKRNPISSLYIHAPARWCASTQRHSWRPRSPIMSARPALGDRVDRAAGDLSAQFRRAGADPDRGRGPRGRCRAHAGKPRHHPRHDRVGGGDDGAWSLSGPSARA
jgi:Adenylosuccinate lyase